MRILFFFQSWTYNVAQLIAFLRCNFSVQLVASILGVGILMTPIAVAAERPASLSGFENFLFGTSPLEIKRQVSGGEVGTHPSGHSYVKNDEERVIAGVTYSLSFIFREDELREILLTSITYDKDEFDCEMVFDRSLGLLNARYGAPDRGDYLKDYPWPKWVADYTFADASHIGFSVDYIESSSRGYFCKSYVSYIAAPEGSDTF